MKANGTYRELAPFLTLGFQLASAVVILFFVGRWVDATFGSSPVGQLAGVLFGVIGGMWKFFHAVNAMNRRSEPPENDRT